MGGEGGRVSVLGRCLSHCKKAVRSATQPRSQQGYATLLNMHNPQSHDTWTSRYRFCQTGKRHAAEHNRRLYVCSDMVQVNVDIEVR